jgi:hypothetical protein
MWFFNLRGQMVEAATLADLSRAYSRIRDASGEGMRTFPTPAVRVGGSNQIIGRFSYNGRIWNRDRIIFDNRVEG